MGKLRGYVSDRRLMTDHQGGRFGSILVSLFSILFVDAKVGCAESSELGKTKIASSAYKANSDLQFQSSMNSSDHGLRRGSDQDPPRTNQFLLNLLRLGAKFSGVRTEARIELDLNRTANSSIVHRAILENKLSRIVSLRIGQDELLLGGWEQKEPPADRLALSTYLSRRGLKSGAPLPETAPAALVGFNLGDSGDVLIQVTDDVNRGKDSQIASFNGNASQPAILAQYMPVTGPVLPLVQVGSYDINHSKHLQIGVKADLGRLHAFADYLLDLRETTVDGLRTVQRINSVVFFASYEFKNAVKPFIKFDAFESRSEGSTLPPNNNALTCESNCYGNQGHQATVGTWFAIPSPYVSPFVSYTQRSGRFLKQWTDDTAPDSYNRESIAQIGLSGKL